MKKIVIVDGGPRKNMNTAQLLQRFAEGAKSVGEGVEVKSVRLYNAVCKLCKSACIGLIVGNNELVERFLIDVHIEVVLNSDVFHKNLLSLIFISENLA